MARNFGPNLRMLQSSWKWFNLASLHHYSMNSFKWLIPIVRCKWFKMACSHRVVEIGLFASSLLEWLKFVCSIMIVRMIKNDMFASLWCEWSKMVFSQSPWKRFKLSNLRHRDRNIWKCLIRIVKCKWLKITCSHWVVEIGLFA